MSAWAGEGGGRPAPAALGALLGFVLVAVAFWPGIAGVDTGSQLAQARLGVVFGGHPPVLTVAWRHLDRLWPGTGLPFLLQGALLWSGLGLLLHEHLRGRWRSIPLLLAVAVFPPLVAHWAQLLKDTVHTAGLTLGAALLLRAQTRGSRRCLLLACLPLLVAAASRHNGAPALLPLGVWAGKIVADWRPTPWLGRRGPLAGGAAALLIGAAAMLGNRCLTDVPVHLWQYLCLWDLAGVAVRSGEHGFPAYLAVSPDLEAVRRNYTPAHCSQLCQLPPDAPTLRPTTDPAKLALLRTAWFRALRRHPGAWLGHRAEVVRHLLGLYGGPNRTWTPVRRSSVLVEPPYRPGWWAWLLLGSAEALRDGLLFRPWAWAVLGVVLLVRGIRRADRAVVALACSGLLHLLAILPVAPCADFRYTLWTVQSVVLAALLCLPGARAEAAPPEPAAGSPTPGA